MYKGFFGLDRGPFEMSPDPRFLYPTPQHYEALASLYYAIRERKGFVVLTGEVGTGKTLLLRCLLEKLEKQHVKFAYVFSPALTPVELLRYVAAELGLRIDWKDKSDLLLGLSHFLIRQNDEGMTTVLVVDEAHLLSWDVLEEARLLNNLETHRGKLLQIVLVGQPELDEKLDSPGLRQLKQRVAFRCQLRPLSPDQLREYIAWRLKRAGANGHPPQFPANTLAAIHRYSHGYPRLVNAICENALISAYAANSCTVSASMVDEVCRDLRISADPIPHEAPVTEASSTQNRSHPNFETPAVEPVELKTAKEVLQPADPSQETTS
ncbi:MAG: ExeA family protein [Terriglobia bacterium]